MGPKEIAMQVAEEQGWTLATLFDLVCDFIEEIDGTVAMDNYLHAIAGHENEQRS
jgi:hypothetical protein